MWLQPLPWQAAPLRATMNLQELMRHTGNGASTTHTQPMWTGQAPNIDPSYTMHIFEARQGMVHAAEYVIVSRCCGVLHCRDFMKQSLAGMLHIHLKSASGLPARDVSFSPLLLAACTPLPFPLVALASIFLGPGLSKMQCHLPIQSPSRYDLAVLAGKV